MHEITKALGALWLAVLLVANYWTTITGVDGFGGMVVALDLASLAVVTAVSVKNARARLRDASTLVR